MSAQDPTCVFVAHKPETADFIANWLNNQGIAAQVVTHLKESDGVVMTPFANSDMSNHLEVHVENADQAEDVKQMIVERQEDLLEQARQVDAAPKDDMVVVCEACGKSSVFSGELQGTVQDCPHCGHYVDVPGGDEEYDWSIVDETVSEEDQQDDDEEAEEETWG